jgi:TolB-like protein/tetratricopeptide (TPR) repeat protein
MPPPHDAVCAQLDRILAHETFSNARRLSAFLRYVVEQTLAGRSAELKEYLLGVEVFGRGDKFDPRLDSIVRVEAGKIRSKLAEYYDGAGANDPVLIQLTKGAYVPAIVQRDSGTPRQDRLNTTAIAVLPFVNLSSDPESNYFSDGLTEELINTLSAAGGLQVVARTSVFQFKGKVGDIREIGARLGAAHVLEGTVRKAGDKLRVTAQLIDVQSGYKSWSKVYERMMSDVFALQEELSSTIAGALGAQVVGERRPKSIEAYQAYLMGRFHRHQWTVDGFGKSCECYERALQYDPEYAQALAGLSEAFALRAMMMDVDPGPYFSRAREAATRSLAITEHSALAHVSLGFIHNICDWQWGAAESAYRRALELNPGLAEAYHLYGILLAVLGRFDRASTVFTKARQLDPLSLVINTHGALVPYFSRDYDAAEVELQKVFAMDKNFPEVHWLLAWVREWRGQYHEALAHLQTAVELGGDNPVIRGDVGCVLALLGRREEAMEVIRALESTFRSPHIAATSIAHIYSYLGEPGPAHDWLDAAFDVRDTMLPWICGDPRWQGLWPHARLRQLRDSMG